MGSTTSKPIYIEKPIKEEPKVTIGPYNGYKSFCKKCGKDMGVSVSLLCDNCLGRWW